MDKYHYINRANIGTAARIAQRDYCRSVLAKATPELEAIEKLISIRSSGAFEECFSSLKEGRKRIVKTISLSDEAYARKWQEVKYEGKPFLPGDPEFYTLRGERVRSKSEVIIANLLYTLGIPYRYEYPLKLKNGKIIYPDFTLLNVRTREEVIFEHLGMLGMEEYAAKAVAKINELMNSGFYLGDNLLVSFETSSSQLDTKAIEAQLGYLLL